MFNLSERTDILIIKRQKKLDYFLHFSHGFNNFSVLQRKNENLIEI